MKKASLLCILMLLLCGCGSGSKEGRTAIAVSFEPQAALLKEMAGDSFDIVTLLPAKYDPETYQPSVSTMRSLADADIYFTLETPGFETTLAETISDNFPDLEIVDTSEGIDRIYGTHAASSGSPEGFDPHMMTSIRNCVRIADRMAVTIAERYPEKADEIRKGHDRLVKRLRALDDSISHMDIRGKAFMVGHPVLSYFARDYGLVQLPLETDGKEASPAQIAVRIDSIRKAGPVVYVLENADYNDREVNAARQLQLGWIEVTLNSADWLDHLMRIAHEIDRD